MTILAGAAAAGAIGGEAHAQAQDGLNWKAFPAGENGFFRAPVLVWGPTEAVLIDGGFTLSDGRALVEEIKATGRKLTTVYISQSDPDYYFSLGPIKAAFPDARIIAAPETLAAIEASVDKKLATWGPQLGDNGPKTREDIVFPTAFEEEYLSIDGLAIEIVPAAGLPNRRYFWATGLSAIFGGVLVFSGVHVWTADTATAQARAAWVATLNSILSRSPSVVVPGHMTPTAPTGTEAVVYTRDYLLVFEEELAKATNSADLIAAMTARYPDAGMGVALQVGAKVATGEMAWG